jgi:Ca2+-binding EF-hand superfamily protein
MSDINYDDMVEEAVPVSDDDLKSISELADRQMKLEDWIERQEAKLKEAKANMTKLTGELLPEAMRQAGIREFKLSNGCEVLLNMDIKASITKANQEAAFNWLREHNQGDLIRNEFKVSYGAGEDEQADCLSTFLADVGQDYNQKEYVHHSTLPAFVRRELDEHDHDENWEKMFGVYRHTYTKIVRPKT